MSKDPIKAKETEKLPVDNLEENDVHEDIFSFRNILIFAFILAILIFIVYLST